MTMSAAAPGFLIPWHRKHLSNPYASTTLRNGAAQDLQWKDKGLFASDTPDIRPRLGIPFSWHLAGRPGCSSEKDAPALQATLYYQSNGFMDGRLVCLNHSGALIYNQKSEWQINPFKTILYETERTVVQKHRGFLSAHLWWSCSKLF